MKTAFILTKIFELINDNIINNRPIFRRLSLNLSQFVESEIEFDIFTIKLVLTAFGCFSISYTGSPIHLSEGEAYSSVDMMLRFDVPN